ncbi:leucine--tRNA ligase [bacterium]|nr:leucine--tRNA ligase [bacterium]
MQVNEEYWRNYWEEKNIFKADEKGKKFYVLEMFPYPSGDLHVGHLRNYVIGDVYTRYYKMKGYSILHPMGWDAFGLPAENAAIQRKISPKEWTLENISVSKATFKKLGITYDWDREVTTCLPDYYKWTQWLFIQLYENGLAYRSNAPVNWCPSCMTVLANEQVESGECYRCGTEVTKKDLEQWYFGITKYADRLLEDLEDLPLWPEKVKLMQRNWIGRSYGVTVNFPLKSGNGEIKVYTTRPDTLYGVTFMAVAPENPLLNSLDITPEKRQELDAYIDQARKKSEVERTGTKTEKDGVFTGVYAINPLTGEDVEIFVADYVLATYGTGSVMGVPAHDERDFSFSKKYSIPIKVVINPEDEQLDISSMTNAYIEPGIMTDSGEFTGMISSDAIEKIIEHLEAADKGKRTVNYRLRDWLISRQRYWGAPIPMIHCPDCGMVPEKVENLPILLPDSRKVDYVPKGTSPLGSVDDFVNTKCPKCGKDAKRDTDTMDTFVDSSWYFLRYTDALNSDSIFSKQKADYWLPVDLYIGGVEHAILHLMFSRFITKFLHDIKMISHQEPFKQLFTQGMVMNRINGDLEVMSKSKGNAVPVGPFVEKEGVDVARGTILFIAPPEADLEWKESSVDSIKRFISRIQTVLDAEEGNNDDKEIRYQTHLLVKKVNSDIERFKLNTAIAAMMEYVNFIHKKMESADFSLSKDTKAMFIKVMAPFFPYLAEEYNKLIFGGGSIFEKQWPVHDETALMTDQIEIPVQIKGKLRAVITVGRSATKEEILKLAYSNPNIKKHLQGMTIRKEIYVPGKMVNIII